MAATRASGTNAVRYGTMKDNVLALKVVLATGEIIATSRRAKKSSAGYDLTRLLVGSEGTLGIITEVGLKLYGIPESIISGVCPFPSVEACCNSTIQAIQMALPVARIELVDAEHIKAINAYSKLALPERPILFLWASDDPALQMVDEFSERLEVLGGAGAYWLAGTFGGHFQRRLLDPDGGSEEVELYLPRIEQGFAAAARHVTRDIEHVLLAARHYAELYQKLVGVGASATV
jgi:D-lactate dehydrogenase (cytochrome)